MITTKDVLEKLADINSVTTKKKKSGWITIRDTKNRAYIKDAKYGVAVWSLKAQKTLKIETEEDLNGFITALKNGN